MSKNSNPFDHYSEKVLWLFVLSVIVSILSVVLSFFIAQGYMDSVKQIKIECGASLPTKTVDVSNDSENTFY